MAAPVLTFVREPNDGGDLGAWAPYMIAQTRAGGLGALSLELYNNGGALNMREGFAGIDDGVKRGVIECTTDGDIDTTGMTANCWHQVELSIVGIAATLTIAAIAGATSETSIPATVKAAYDASKQGYYMTASKRLVGVVYLRTALALGTIVNCEHCKRGFKNMVETIDTTTGVTLYNYAQTLTVPIGAWNMNTAQSTEKAIVPFNIQDRIISLSVTIIRDDGMRCSFVGDDVRAGTFEWKLGSLYVVLNRTTSGFFDTADFDDALPNRGFITVTYCM